MITVALAGNPNCGKTTLFNALTGLHYKVGNYPGVTVERKEGPLNLPGIEEEVVLVDLPGIYSLSSTSLDEKIATQCLFGELGLPPDIVIVVVDAANLERNLYLVTQLIDCRIPVVVALNMVDLAEKAGIKVFDELLSKELNVPVISVIAKKRSGLNALKDAVANVIREPRSSSKRFFWCEQTPVFLDEARALGAKTIPNIERRARVSELTGCALLSESQAATDPQIAQAVSASQQKLRDLEIDPHSFEATKRYHWIGKIVPAVSHQTASNHTTLMKKIDAVLTHKIWGSVIFIALMGLIFQSIFTWSQVPMDMIDSFMTAASDYISNLLPDGQLKSLIVDGMIGGVGSVLVFIPQIAILFMFLGLLEDSGYLSRAAFLMDGIMRRVGLQGRSFIPLLSSFACAIPGILSTRTIPSWADRLTTIMVAPLMSCSARLPVYAVLIGAFIPNDYVFGFISLQGLTLLAMYLLGIVGAAVVSWILKRTLLKREPAFFVMELPPFRRPSLRLVFREVYDRVKIFCQSAGTVILACSVVLWFLASYPRTDTGEAPALQESYAGDLGAIIEPVVKPLGYNWEIGIGLVASFAAREVFVSSLATIYNVSNDDDTSQTLISTLKQKRADGSFTTAAAISLMVFYVFACQCMSTIAVCRRETGSWKWVAFMVTYMTILAYGMAFLAYHGALIYFTGA